MIGRTLAQYKITAKVGEGGMGQVYRAQDSRLGRDVAIKVLPEHLAADRDFLQRFAREARLLAGLNHPNIAAIHGFEEVDGLHFLVMELVEGENLSQTGNEFRFDTPEILFERPSIDWSPTWADGFDVSSDSQRFLMWKPEALRDDEQPRIVIVHNWFEEFRQN